MVFAARRMAALLALSSAALALVACAPVTPQTYSVGRTQVSFDEAPQLEWRYWGSDSDLIPVAPRDLSRDEPLQAKVWQMRTSLGELVAVMAVRSNVDDLNRQPTVWTQDCPKQQGVLVERTQGLNVGRVDCLRIKRTANSEEWLAQNDPRMAARLSAGGIYFARPMSHVSYHFTTGSGGLVEVQVLADHRLVRPETHNSIDFFSAGRPLLTWAQDLSQALRQSTGFMNGVFKVPPFPFPIDEKPYYQTKAAEDSQAPKPQAQVRMQAGQPVPPPAAKP
ncbi:MAG: hypothetical protein ACN6O3_11380 [Comamonas sp.]